VSRRDTIRRLRAERVGGQPPVFYNVPDWSLAAGPPISPGDVIEAQAPGHRRATAAERKEEAERLNARRLKAIAWFTEQRRRAREPSREAAPSTNPSAPTGHVYTGKAEYEVDLQTRRLARAWKEAGPTDIEFR
jgi:hypothetical protein